MSATLTETTKLPAAMRKYIDDAEVITKQTKQSLQVTGGLQFHQELDEKLKAALAEPKVTKAATARLQKSRDALRATINTLKDKETDSAAVGELEQHSVGSLFPPMADEQFAELRTSMETRGFLPQYPIIIHEGKVLDGWHRHQAAALAGVVPVYTDYKDDDPVGFAMSANLQRRHLTDDQRSVIAGELAAFEPSMTTSEAAASVSVTASKANRGRKLAGRSEKLADAVRTGELSLIQAERISDDPRLLKKANSESFDDLPKLVSAAYKSAGIGIAEEDKVQRVTLELSEWHLVDEVYDSEGEPIGQAYVYEAPDLEDAAALLERVGDACERSVDPKVVKATMKTTLSTAEIGVLYVDFEATDPPEDMTVAKQVSRLAPKIAEWYENSLLADNDELAEDK